MARRRGGVARVGAVVALLACGAGCERAGADGDVGAAGGGAGPTAAPVVDSGFIATADGVRLFYRTVGDGEQDVVIPVAAYLEEPLVRLASPARRLVFYDLRARGRSDAGDRSRITLDRQIADLEALRGALTIDSMVLVGWSGLGMEMTVYAMRNPERVTRLVQVASIAARDEPHNARAYRTRAERTDAGALADLRVRREGGEFAGDPAAYCRALSAVTLPASLGDSTAAASVPDVCRYPNEHPDSLARIWPSLLGSFAGYDWREEIAALRVPRLVIHGATDAFPLEGSREWVPPGSNARLLVIAEAGHLPFLERPDVFFPAVEAFLRGEWPSGSEQP